MKNSRVRVVADYADTQFSNIVIKYLCENQKVCETVFACSYSAQVKSFKQKNGRKSRDTVSLSLIDQWKQTGQFFGRGGKAVSWRIRI